MRLNKVFVLTPLIAFPFFSEGLAQVTYTATWSGQGTGADSSKTITASGSFTFTSAAAVSDGDFNVTTSPLNPSWLTAFSISLTINSVGGFSADRDDLSNFKWVTDTSSTPLYPSTLLLAGVVNDPLISGDEFTMTTWASGATGLSVGVNQGGVSYNMSLTSFSAVPEPEEWAAIASTGLLAFGIWHRRSRKAKKA